MAQNWIAREMYERMNLRGASATAEQIEIASDIAESLFYDRLSCFSLGIQYDRLDWNDRMKIYDHILNELHLTNKK